LVESYNRAQHPFSSSTFVATANGTRITTGWAPADALFLPVLVLLDGPVLLEPGVRSVVAPVCGLTVPGDDWLAELFV
jgi:hypothetical protein